MGLYKSPSFSEAGAFELLCKLENLLTDHPYSRGSVKAKSFGVKFQDVRFGCLDADHLTG